MATSLNNIVSSGNVDNAVNQITGAVSDPFGAVIQTTLNRVNSLTVNIEKKINQLVKDVLAQTDSKGRVSLQGNTLVITVRREDEAQAKELQKRVMDKIASIQKTITILQNVINALIAIQTAITVYKSLLDLQEVALNSNPATAITFQLIKKSIKIIFLKEIVNQYVKILGNQLLQNKRVLSRLTDTFIGIQVSVKIQDEAGKGSYVDSNTAEILLADDLLGSGITSDSQDFTDENGNVYILKVEKYDPKQIIAKAYDKSSGMIKAQTAPSYFATPEELMEEIKTILNLQS